MAKMSRKLVRDGVRMTNAVSKGEFYFELCEPKEFPKLLLKKLDEEVSELKRAIRAGDVDSTLDELGDLFSVMTKIADQFASANGAAIVESARHKTQARGGFDAGVVLVYDPKNKPAPRPLFKTTQLDRARKKVQ